MKRLAVLMATLTVSLAFALPAGATAAATIIDELQLRGYYLDPGVDVDFSDMEQLVDAHPDVYFVALDADPTGGADLFATEVLTALGVEGTVIVVSPSELGARSTVVDDDTIDRAFDRSIDAFDRSYPEGFSIFAEVVVPEVAVPTSQDSSGETVAPQAAADGSSSGGSGFRIFLIIILVIGGLIWWAIRRSRRSREQMMADRIDEVKAEIQAQLSEAANDVLELEDDVLLSDNQEAKELYYSGSAAYSEFQEKLASATSLAELDELAEGADLALWQLESAEALLEGREPPPKPEPRPEYQPPAPTTSAPRHPQLPEDLQLRRERRDQRGTRPRTRSAGGLGGLGAAAVILRSLQQGRAPRPTSTRRAAQAPGRVQMPDLGRSIRPGTRTPQAPSPSSRPTLRGRGRRRRR